MQTKGLLLTAQYVVLCTAYGRNAWAPRQAEEAEITTQAWSNFTNTTTTSSTTTTSTTTTLTTLTTTTTTDDTTTEEPSSSTSSTDFVETTTNATTTDESTVSSPSSTPGTSISADFHVTSTPLSTGSFRLTTSNGTIHSIPKPTGSSTSSANGTRAWSLNETATFTKDPNPTGGSLLNGTSWDNKTTTAPAVLPTSSSLDGTAGTSTTTNTTSTATKCGIAGSFVTPPSHATKAESIDECKAACRARGPLCKAFEAGTVDGDGYNCWLFAHSLSEMDLGETKDGFSWTFYDRDCDVQSRCGLQGSFITKPIESLRLETLGDCQQACQKNSGCKTFEAGSLDGNEHNCWLFDSPITSLNIGGAYTGWEWSFFDRDCELAP